MLGFLCLFSVLVSIYDNSTELWWFAYACCRRFRRFTVAVTARILTKSAFWFLFPFPLSPYLFWSLLSSLYSIYPHYIPPPNLYKRIFYHTIFLYLQPPLIPEYEKISLIPTSTSRTCNRFTMSLKRCTRHPIATKHPRRWTASALMIYVDIDIYNSKDTWRNLRGILIPSLTGTLPHHTLRYWWSDRIASHRIVSSRASMSSMSDLFVATKCQK